MCVNKDALRAFVYVYDSKSEPASILKVDAPYTVYNFTEHLFFKTTILKFQTLLLPDSNYSLF